MLTPQRGLGGNMVGGHPKPMERWGTPSKINEIGLMRDGGWVMRLVVGPGEVGRVAWVDRGTRSSYKIKSDQVESANSLWSTSNFWVTRS
ncbi:hypothetical protein PZA11_006442 [Diplocarpon coronariae]